MEIQAVWDAARAEHVSYFRGRRLPFPPTMPLHNRIAVKLPDRLISAHWGVETMTDMQTMDLVAIVTFVTPIGNRGKLPAPLDDTFPTDELIAQLCMVLA